MKINEAIARLTLPYKDIYTTVYTVKTAEGVLVFDTATTAEDITEGLLPFLREEGIPLERVKAVFISHNHNDHAGGLSTLLPLLPNAIVYSRSKKIREAFPHRVRCPEDGETLLDVLCTVTIPGHSQDSAGLFDTRTNTLISGDCLQLYGIFGSGAWASNITLPHLHLEALEKLSRMGIREILAAHDYHPHGWHYDSPVAVAAALASCRDALYRISRLIGQNPSLSDEEIARLAEDGTAYPRLNPRVVTAIRENSPFFESESGSR